MQLETVTSDALLLSNETDVSTEEHIIQTLESLKGFGWILYLSAYKALKTVVYIEGLID